MTAPHTHAHARVTREEARQALLDALSAATETEKAERRIRRHLKKKDCRLHLQRDGYHAVDRDTREHQAGPLSLEAMEAWAKAVTP